MPGRVYLDSNGQPIPWSQVVAEREAEAAARAGNRPPPLGHMRHTAPLPAQNPVLAEYGPGPAIFTPQQTIVTERELYTREGSRDRSRSASRELNARNGSNGTNSTSNGAGRDWFADLQAQNRRDPRGHQRRVAVDLGGSQPRANRERFLGSGQRRGPPPRPLTPYIPSNSNASAGTNGAGQHHPTPLHHNGTTSNGTNGSTNGNGSARPGNGNASSSSGSFSYSESDGQ